MTPTDIRRLTRQDLPQAQATLRLMHAVFEEPFAQLSDAYVGTLLERADFWLLGAFVGGQPVGGLTAHVLPMTRSESRELFIYDLAVHPDHQRRGIGRALVEALRALGTSEGIGVAFVPADNEDDHALAFYEALGGEAAPVTIFTFGAS